jgi:hypothetical protein
MRYWDGEPVRFVCCERASSSAFSSSNLAEEGRDAANSLKSCADGVSAHRVLNHEKYGNKLVLVDTPGFDATHKTDRQILDMISKWMTKTYAGFLDLPEIINFYLTHDPDTNDE